MSDGIIPCKLDGALRQRIASLAEVLKTQAHTLVPGMSEKDFYESGLFRGAIEQLRGEFSASMGEKRQFVRHVLNYMQDNGFIKDWESAGESNRYDYMVELVDGRKSAIELKGCLDGNNTNIFERPLGADEFIIWSVCTNAGADPRHNVWSGIHTRLSSEIITREQRVDGLIVWDFACGSVGRPCPKLAAGDPATVVGPYTLPPPCIYTFPGTVPAPRNNPKPAVRNAGSVGVLTAFHAAFGGADVFLNQIEWEVGYEGVNTVRKSTAMRDGTVTKMSRPTAIRRK